MATAMGAMMKGGLGLGAGLCKRRAGVSQGRHVVPSLGKGSGRPSLGASRRRMGAIAALPEAAAAAGAGDVGSLAAGVGEGGAELAASLPEEVSSIASALTGLDITSPLGQLWVQYNAALVTQPVATDVATAVVIYSLSDAAAQKISLSLGESSHFDAERVARYGAFGVADGFCSHHWFVQLDQLIPGNTMAATAEKMALDSVILNPIWTLSFIVAMAAMEGAGAKGAKRRINEDFVQLMFGSYIAWVPINLVIYGVLPLEFRVLGLASGTFLYTVALSYWSNGQGKKARRDSLDTLATVDAEAMATVDIEGK